MAFALLMPLLHAALMGARCGKSTLSRAVPPHSTRTPPRVSAALISLDDPRLIQVTLERKTGIDFGCDISLRWPYVLDIVPGGSADLSGEVRRGDQLVQVAGQSVVGAEMGAVMDQLAAAEGAEIEFLFFRSTREQLIDIAGASTDTQTVSITVQQSGKPDVQFDVPYGEAMRTLMFIMLSHGESDGECAWFGARFDLPYVKGYSSFATSVAKSASARPKIDGPIQYFWMLML